MARLRTNIVANYAGQVWQAVMGFAFVPIYLRWLGAESFGLVALMLSLQAVSQLLDFGAGGAVNRELARRSGGHNDPQSMRDMVRTMEVPIWSLALAVGVAIWLAAPWIAEQWLRTEHMDPARTAGAVTLVAVAITTLWPSSFYTNALAGLEQQARLNLINSVFATLRNAGVLVVLHWISPTIEAFLLWYALVGALNSVTLAIFLWRSLPVGHHRARFRWHEVRTTLKFAGGLFAIVLSGMLLIQLDRLTLSALRPLSELGYYALAISISAGLGRMVLPMFTAIYPRFSRLYAAGAQDEIATLYHYASRLLTAMVASIAAVIAFWGSDVLYLWTGDMVVAELVYVPMLLLVAGSAFNGLSILPYALQLSFGWTSLSIRTNMALLVLAVPYAIWAVSRFGMIGAASTWFLASLFALLVTLPFMHRRLLQGQLSMWFTRAVLPPVGAAVAAAFVLHLLFPMIPRTASGGLQLVLVSATTLGAALATDPTARTQVRSILRHARSDRSRPA